VARPAPVEELDDLLVGLLVDPSRAERLRAAPLDVVALLDRAESHGLADLVVRALRDANVPLGAEERRAHARAAARALDHAAHLSLLRRIDDVFRKERLEAVALKGPLFAERYYAIPSGRSTSDIDLLVAESDLDAALTVLGACGYRPSESPEEERFRREHHHLHCTSNSGPPLELHFHAYRGFGGILRSEPLIARRELVPRLGLAAIGVLCPEDELVYLAVHAAAHRFVRLGWLYDVVLLVRAMSPTALTTAAERATDIGFARQLAYTGWLLRRWFDGDGARLELLGAMSPVRARVIDAMTPEPASAIARTTTRMVYSVALCQDAPRAATYLVDTARSRIRQLWNR
jgi:hypothetical protein